MAYRPQSGIAFLRRNKPLLYGIIALTFPTFSTGCASLKTKWNWVFDGLAVVEPGESGPPLERPEFKSHPFLTAEYQQQLDAISSSYLSAGNEVSLLPNHLSTESKLALIASARSSIFIAIHMIECDQGGEQFLKALEEAAQRGVDVRVIVDGGFWGNVGGYCPEDLEAKNVQFARTNYSFLGIKNDMKLHDKIFIADGEVGITGGQNVGSFWSLSDGHDGHFRDTDILVKGPVVNEMALRFVKMWKTVRPFERDLDNFERVLVSRSRQFIERKVVGPQNYQKWLAKKTLKGLCRFVGQDPYIGTHYVLDAYTSLVKASQNHIVFHVPALNGLGNPKQEALLHALDDASRDSRVRVDVLTNGPGLLHSVMLNKTLGWIWGAYTLGKAYDSVKDTNINVYVHKSWLHSKLFDFDGLAIAVGSFNFDETGVSWMEDTLICMDNGLSAQTREMLEDDFTHARLLPKIESKTAQRN